MSESSDNAHPSAEGKSSSASKRPEARAAIYGLLGAVIGALASFGGVYWSQQQTQSTARSASEQSAVVATIAKADDYANGLFQLRDALINNDSASYSEIRARDRKSVV